MKTSILLSILVTSALAVLPGCTTTEGGRYHSRGSANATTYRSPGSRSAEKSHTWHPVARQGNVRKNKPPRPYYWSNKNGNYLPTPETNTNTNYQPQIRRTAPARRTY